MQPVTDLVGKTINAFLNPTLGLIFAAGTLVFIFGIVEFLVGLSSGNTKKQENGQQHMMWGLLGMFVMASAWAIVRLIGSIVGNPVSNVGF